MPLTCLSCSAIDTWVNSSNTNNLSTVGGPSSDYILSGGTISLNDSYGLVPIPVCSFNAAFYENGINPTNWQNVTSWPCPYENTNTSP